MGDARACRLFFFVGLFLICMCGLMLQIIETRILSVITWYHLAFLAISMAMFGMTAGSLYVYFRPSQFSSERLLENLTWTCSAFAASTFISLLLQITTVVAVTTPAMSALLWLKLILILVPPYVFAGMAISLALTRSPWPAPLVYGVDLIGAATGCLGVLVLLDFLDAISAVIIVAAIGALAATCFARAHRAQPRSARPKTATADALPDEGQAPAPHWTRLLILRRPAWLFAAFMSLGVLNGAVQPNGLIVSIAKHQVETSTGAVIRWNSFSRIKATGSGVSRPFMWGPSSAMPDVSIAQREMNIDGAAGTTMYAFDGDLRRLDFLRYDVTNLAYGIRHDGRAAVIGVGGGRDLLSAYLFGFRDVTGIELNPIFVDFLERTFRDFNHVADLSGMRLYVDEARSWFARSRDRFDLIQMSMVDTWAATGAGAFSLSENGLYTVEGWQSFLGHLRERGVLTVSRWYSPRNIDETGRLLALAATALRRLGVQDPANHIFLAASSNLATLIASPQPLSRADVATLTRETTSLGFSVLASPGVHPQSPALAAVLQQRSADGFESLSNAYHIDLSPATDARPFFFQQLRLTDPGSWLRALRVPPNGGGVMRGNLLATLTLLLLMVLSCGLVLATVVLPASSTIRQTRARLVWSGTLYFLLIGLGFMFVEIGLIQRISVYLGHPVYGLAIGLFGIIVSTGLGSLLSSLVPLRTRARFTAWAGILALDLLLLPAWLPTLISTFASAALPGRTLVCLIAIVPLGILMGFGFPTGIQLVDACDSRPTPWFWAVNGAAGVFASSLAVAISIAFSINVTLCLGAACYLLLAPVGWELVHASPRGPATDRSPREPPGIVALEPTVAAHDSRDAIVGDVRSP